MNYSDIKDFNERCNSHPDHQKGIITERVDREELEKAVEDAWRDYDIAYIALMAYYKENT